MTDPSPRDDWRLWLPALQGFPLIPCGAGAEGKAPINPATGAPATQWQHGAFTPEQIHAMNGVVLCCGTRCGPDAGGLLVFDLDGASAIEHCRQNGCDPATTTTWQIHRSTAPDRLKVAFRVPQHLWDQLPSKKKLVTKAATEGAKGEQIELFWATGQVIVLGHHRESGGFYYWPQGRTPQELAEIPPTWWALVQQIIGPAAQQPSQPPLPAPPRPAELSDLDRARAAIRHLDPGMSHDEWVEIGMALHAIDASAGLAIWDDWSRGSSKYKNSRELEQKWRSFKSQPGGIGPGTLFAKAKQAGWVDLSRQKASPPTPPLNGEQFIPPDAPTPEPEPWQLQQEDEEDAAAARSDLLAELQSFRDANELAATVTPQLLFPPDVAAKLTGYATEQQLPVHGFYLPILCTVASIIGNRAHCVPQLGDAVKGIAVLWGMSIGGVSAGKSPITGPAIELPLVAWHAAEREKHEAAIKEWNRGKAKAEEAEKRRRNGDESGGSDDPVGDYLAENPQPERRYIISTDTTIEKLEINLLSPETPGHLSFHDELSGWFTNLCRERGGKSDRPKWLSIGSGAALLTDRVNRTEVIIPNPRCSLFGNLQPARIAGLWEADVKACQGVPDADGLWARFHMMQLPEWDYRYRKTEVQITPVLANLYKAIDASAARLPRPAPGKACEIPLAPDAVPIWAQWVDDLLEMRKARTLQEDKGYIIKLRGTTLTLSLLLHAIRCGASGVRMDVPITADTLMAAIGFAGLLIVERDRVLCAVREADATGKVKELLARGQEWRRAHGSRPVPLDQLRQWCLPRKRMKAAERRAWLEAVVRDAPELGELREVQKSVQWVPPA
jgi:hypothetical protein